MKSLREDVLLSRLIQMSFMGTLILIGMLLLLQEYGIPMSDFVFHKELQELPVLNQADSLAQTEKSPWLKHSMDWMETTFLSLPDR
ncbi:hypothetical protein [Catalinimonas niigatensis]|uniref:hypothetical protein n=1 Tax=Catalinimonas niigatensis TaxID=1397264 RepID=UPI002665455C|nr:hypothetical protein [Catalinimonas niigatensis]WPP52446.1 hypothetical protein PZB72_08625 [Catalinimonas niigatensis]